jgi:hypothetical protein
MTLVTLPWIPQIEYDICGSPVTLLMSLPQRPWDYVSQGAGGSDQAASGVQEAFQIRRDRGRRVRIRFYEEEWPDLELMLTVVQRQASTIHYTFDVLDSTTRHEFRLIDPAMGDGIIPSRSDQPGILELDMELHEVDGLEVGVHYYEDATHYTGSVVS